MMYISQIIMLYTLNLYRALYQLYLNKTGIKKNAMLEYSNKIQKQIDTKETRLSYS